MSWRVSVEPETFQAGVIAALQEDCAACRRIGGAELDGKLKDAIAGIRCWVGDGSKVDRALLGIIDGTGDDEEATWAKVTLVIIGIKRDIMGFGVFDSDDDDGICGASAPDIPV